MAYTERRRGGWRARWQLPDGRYASKDGFATKREAKEYGETQEAEIRTGTWVDPKKGQATVDEWWQRWYPAQDLAPNTLDNYAQQYRRHIKPRWGEIRLADIAALDVQRFEKELRARLASASVVVIMSVSNRMMNDAAFERVIGFSPIAPGKRGRRYYGPPKTVLKDGKGREIDLPPFLVELLIDFVEAMGERDLLFPNRKGEPRRHTDWLRVWRCACDGWHGRIDQRTGQHTPGAEPVCETLRFHDLRHSHRTLMVALGTEEPLQDYRLGHAPRGVQGVYSHPTTEMRLKLVEGLEHHWRGFHEQPA
jgi:integrase